jgi:hypothetical protein
MGALAVVFVCVVVMTPLLDCGGLGGLLSHAQKPWVGHMRLLDADLGHWVQAVV